MSTSRDDHGAWLTVKEYARTYGVSEKTVRRWIRHDKVIAVQHEKRGHWRIRSEKHAKAS